MANLTPNEKVAAILGQAQSIGFNKWGKDYPKILAEHKKNFPLPGETVYENIEDDPEYQRLKIVATIRSNKNT